MSYSDSLFRERPGEKMNLHIYSKGNYLNYLFFHFKYKRQPRTTRYTQPHENKGQEQAELILEGIEILQRREDCKTATKIKGEKRTHT